MEGGNYIRMYMWLHICIYVIYTCVCMGVYMCVCTYIKKTKGSSFPFRTAEDLCHVFWIYPQAAVTGLLAAISSVCNMEAAWPVFFLPRGKPSRSTHTASASLVENCLPGIRGLFLSAPWVQRITSGAAFLEWQYFVIGLRDVGVLGELLCGVRGATGWGGWRGGGGRVGGEDLRRPAGGERHVCAAPPPASCGLVCAAACCGAARAPSGPLAKAQPPSCGKHRPL